MSKRLPKPTPISIAFSQNYSNFLASPSKNRMKKWMIKMKNLCSKNEAAERRCPNETVVEASKLLHPKRLLLIKIRYQVLHIINLLHNNFLQL
jgi:hypothetical protein